MIYRGSRIPEDDDLYSQLKRRDNVRFYLNSTVKEIRGDISVDSVVVSGLSPGSHEQEIHVSGLFIEMGYIAKTDFVKDLVKLNNNKEIITDKLGRTSTEGVFAAGDVTDMPYKQAVISAGEGATAALSAYNYIQARLGRQAVSTDWKSVKIKVPEP